MGGVGGSVRAGGVLELLPETCGGPATGRLYTSPAKGKGDREGGREGIATPSRLAALADLPLSGGGKARLPRVRQKRLPVRNSGLTTSLLAVSAWIAREKLAVTYGTEYRHSLP